MSDRVLVACDACARSTSGRCGVHASIGVVVPPFGSPIGAPGSGVPLRTLPGPDWQAECGAAREDRDRLAREVARLERDLERERAEGTEQLVEAQNRRVAVKRKLDSKLEQLNEVTCERDRLEAEVAALRAAADAPPYVDCICPGCPRKVPQAWASGMCEPCCAEDCEHTDGARAVAVERDELRESNERLCAQVERLLPALHERDRLRAALAETEENVQTIADVICNAGDFAYRGAARGSLAALRARAGESPPTHEACNEALAGLRSMVGRQQAEVEQLRAQVGAAVGEVNKQLVKVTAFDDLRRVAHAFDARETAERNRATAQMVRDLEAAGVNHDQREVGAQAQPAGAAAAPTGQAGGAQELLPVAGDKSAGSVGPPAGPGVNAAVPGAGWWSRYPPISGIECTQCGAWNGVPVTAVHIGVDPAAPGADRSVPLTGESVVASATTEAMRSYGREYPRINGVLCDKCGHWESEPIHQRDGGHAFVPPGATT